MGYAYYAHYLRWFEIGRTEFLRDLGTTYREVEEGGVLFPVTEAYVKYLSPVRYDELIEIRTRVAFVKRASLKLEYEVADAETGTVHARGHTVHAAVDAGGNIVRINEKFIFLIKRA
ncbi:MAG: acyl-CoA thioesterase [Deltaproteobacteria bacterium]|nr:acyl-CoA thioesterase [Candidatus Zymogenaceae bacterium]